MTDKLDIRMILLNDGVRIIGSVEETPNNLQIQFPLEVILNLSGGYNLIEYLPNILIEKNQVLILDKSKYVDTFKIRQKIVNKYIELRDSLKEALENIDIEVEEKTTKPVPLKTDKKGNKEIDWNEYLKNLPPLDEKDKGKLN